MGAPPGQAMPPQALVQPATSGIGTPKRPSAGADNGRRSAASRFAESADDGRGTIFKSRYCILRVELHRRRHFPSRSSKGRLGAKAGMLPVLTSPRIKCRPFSGADFSAKNCGETRGCVTWYIAAKEIRYHVEAPAAKRDGQRHRAFPRKRSSPSTAAEPPLGSVYHEKPFLRLP